MDKVALRGGELPVFRKRAARSRTTIDLKIAFGTFVRSFGFTAFAVGLLPGQEGVGDDPFLLTDWPRAWLELYAREGFASEDAAVAAAMTAVEPFTWTEMQESRPGASARLFAAARRFGWTDGLMIPVRMSSGSTTQIGVASLAAPTLRDLTGTQRGLVVAGSVHAFYKALDLRGRRTRAALSRREIEALTFVSQGYGDREISVAMGIAVTTAHSYIEQAKKKLGAVSRAQSVAIAVSQGLIGV